MNNQTKKFLELSQAERERNAAVELLQRVIKSDVETELDKEIAYFLEKIDELPDEWLNYFDNETDEYEE